jgi:hypothetical protein
MWALMKVARRPFKTALAEASTWKHPVVINLLKAVPFDPFI